MSPIKPSIILYKKLLVQSLKIKQHKERGFTLIELLVAMVILTIVVGMTGTGLVFVMSKNTSSDGEITQQTNLRRALDFIGDEIRSASVVNTTSPGWTIPTFASPAPTNILYLEIPTPVDSVSSTGLTVPNHGLVKANAVKLSGTTMPSGVSWPTGITTQVVNGVTILDTTVTYYVSATSLTTNTLQLVTGSGASITFGTTAPQNFAIRRLVFYYPAYDTATANAGWKGDQVVYRSTGNCPVNTTDTTNDPSNCLVMVDSLIAQPTTPSDSNAPFFPSITPVGSKQATIYLKGKLCSSSACTTSTTTNVSMTAISRATLQ